MDLISCLYTVNCTINTTIAVILSHSILAIGIEVKPPLLRRLKWPVSKASIQLAEISIDTSAVIASWYLQLTCSLTVAISGDVEAGLLAEQRYSALLSSGSRRKETWLETMFPVTRLIVVVNSWSPGKECVMLDNVDINHTLSSRAVPRTIWNKMHIKKTHISTHAEVFSVFHQHR